MAVVILEIPDSSQQAIRRHGKLADQAHGVFLDGLKAACSIGADVLMQGVVTGDFGITARHPASGLASSIRGWIIDSPGLIGAVGVPSDSPAAAYAGILQRGGVIRPVRAKALAVPVSAEAKLYSSPRDMPGLDMIPRRGRPPLLVRQLQRRGAVKAFELHWVLVQSVTIPAFAWLTKGARKARPAMHGAFKDVVTDYTRQW